MNYVDIVKYVFWIITTILSVLTLHYMFFLIVGIFTYNKYPSTEDKKNYGIVISARNEGLVIENLINSIRKNNYPQDKLHIFVIAHNCNDNTAEIARKSGATVYEYNNPEERTKGYALKHLFECIIRDYGVENFDGFFVFDADNILDKNFFSKMNDAFVATGCKDVITSFRNSKNFGTNIISGMYGIHFMSGCRLECRGRTILGCSTRVQGTAFLLASDMLKDGWNYVTLTEDWELSADQILQGNKIFYCDEAMTYDEQPVSVKIMIRQRLRWAKGHLLVFNKKFFQLLRNIFTPKGKNKGSSYDIMTNIIPSQIIAVFLFIMELILLAFCPLFNIEFKPVVLELLKSAGVTLLTMYVSMFVQAVVIFILERKRIKKIPVYKKILMTFCWPLFTLINYLIAFVALFKKIEWKAIPHIDETSHENVNDDEEYESVKETAEEVAVQSDVTLEAENNENNNN